MTFLLRCCILACVPVLCAALDALPQPAPAAPAIPSPRDAAFAGTLEVAVDASDLIHKVFRVSERVPVQTSGDNILLYPQWEGGSHAPTAALPALSGLIVQANGQRLEWNRDPVDMFAFHVDVPAEVSVLEVDFQILSPTSGAVVMTPDMLTLAWSSVVLYPAGWFTRNIPVVAKLTLPAGFQLASSLESDHDAAVQHVFKPTSLEQLADSPVYAGRFFSRLELGSSVTPVHLDLFGDNAAALSIGPVQLARLRTLVKLIGEVFGAPHYEHYDFIVSLSDLLPSDGGEEHLRSSTSNFRADFLGNERAYLDQEDLLAHEYVHSWNGRFRMPADLWTPNFNVPARGSLLWVYEGQTEFWGKVFAARAGMRSYAQALDNLAIVAAIVANRPGRRWKSLQDSTSDALYMAGPGHSVVWRDWQRREDYYPEGVMLWLNVDMLIREQTHDTRSLADFAHTFFAGPAGSTTTRTYTFADVCVALQGVAAFDWASFLRRQLDTHDDAQILDGLGRAGYRLDYSDVPSESFHQLELDQDIADLSYSIGFKVNGHGILRAVSWEGVAFRAGLVVGAQLISVNGQAYDGPHLLAAVKAAAQTPLTLGFKADGQTRSVTLAYRGTLRYPILQRIPGSVDRLHALFAEPAR